MDSLHDILYIKLIFNVIIRHKGMERWEIVDMLERHADGPGSSPAGTLQIDSVLLTREQR